MATSALKWDAQMFEIYGLPPTAEGRVEYQDWRARVVPEDLAHQEELLQDIVASCGRGEQEFRIVRASDHAVRFIQAAALAVAGTDGQTARVV